MRDDESVQKKATVNRRFRYAIYLVFGVSGAVALVYQVLWMRWLTRIFGYTTASVSVVLTVFMAGLALGSWLAGKYLPKITRSLRWYAWAEIGIGLFAVSFPWLTHGIDWIYVQMVSTETAIGWSLSLRVVLSFLLLAIPTTLMGTTFPFLTEFFRAHSKDRKGWKVGLLYAANTVGAAVGAITTSFILIEWIGERDSTLVGAVLNFIAAGVALRLDGPVPAAEPSGPRPAVPPLGRVAFYILAVGGGVALASEVLWTRLLETLIGNSTYAFSLILVVYLLGIACGSWLMSLYIKKIKRLVVWLVGTQAAIGAWTLIALNLYNAQSSLLASGVAVSMGRILWDYVIASIVLVPLALFSGAAFPLAIRLLEPGTVNARGDLVARAYVYNTIGAMVGAFTAGFLIAPLLDFFEALNFLGAISGITALGGAAWVYFGRAERTARYPLGAVAAGALLCIFVGAAGTRGESRYRQRFEQNEEGWVVSFHRPGLQGVTTAVSNPQSDRLRILLVNGMGMTIKATVTKMMAHVPMLAHPDPQDTLVICFGMGTTYRSAIAYGGNVTVVELVDEVYQAFPVFFDDADEVSAYEKGRMITNDGRNFLKLNRSKFDVITVDPPPPIDAAGVNNLYSLEFLELARNNLKEGGIMAHWIPFPGSAAGVGDWNTFNMLIKTFAEVFPYASMLKSKGFPGVHVLGSSDRVEFSKEELDVRIAEAEIYEDMTEWDEVPVEYFLGLQPIPSAFPPGTSLITDDHPNLEFYLMRRWRAGLTKTHRPGWWR